MFDYPVSPKLPALRVGEPEDIFGYDDEEEEEMSLEEGLRRWSVDFPP